MLDLIFAISCQFDRKVAPFDANCCHYSNPSKYTTLKLYEFEVYE